MKAPCKGCPDRTTGENRTPCHMTCEKYAAFKEARQAELRARALELDAKAATIEGFERVQRIKRSGKWQRGRE